MGRESEMTPATRLSRGAALFDLFFVKGSSIDAG